MVAVRDARFDLLDVGDPDQLGEGPWWSTAEQRLYWVDIEGHRVRRSDLDASGMTQWPTDTEVGFVVPDQAGKLVVGLRDGLGRLDPVTGNLQRGVVVEPRADYRLNDGKTDRSGRLWFGSMHLPGTEQNARFFRADAGGVSTIFTDIGTSNGLGWSPDNSVMYYTDSKAWKIWAFDFDADAGTMSNRRVFADDQLEQIVPDGLTVDGDGCVWGAKWQGSRLIRYAPDGRVLLVLRFPVSRITSCIFVGSRLDTLAVTSAKGPDDDERLAGRVFLINPGVKGIGEMPVPAEVLASIE